MSANEQPDGRVGQRIGDYTKFWEKDPNQESEANNGNRLGSYTDVVNGRFFFCAPCHPSQYRTSYLFL